MLASRRCSPQVASGTACGTGPPPRGVTSSTFAPPALEHSARAARGNAIHGVDARTGGGAPTARVAAPMVVLGANGSDGAIAVTSAVPPPSAAGFVHSTSRPAAGPPDSAPPGRPKIEFGGGVSPNVE